MRIQLAIVMILISALLAACGSNIAATSEISPTLVIRNGLLIDGTGAEPISNASVLIQDEIIVAVGPELEFEVPDGAVIIDANGGAILPGMIDAHTHLLDSLPIEDGTIDTIYQKLYLENPLQAGLTTIMDVGSSYETADRISELRSILDGLGNAAPRVVLTGPSLTAPNSWSMTSFPVQSTSETLDSVESARSATDMLLEAGVDQIKIIQDPGPDGKGPTLGLDLLTAIVETAHADGKWVTVHAEISTMDNVIASGVDSLAHWPISWPLGSSFEFPGSLLEALAKNGTPVVSTFNLMKPQQEDLRAFLDLGGMIAMGTDAPPTGNIGSYSREILMMVLFGMTPMEAIVASTANAAHVVGMGDQLGTLEPGKLADVIVLASNPLEDIRAIRDDVVYVIRGGEVVFQPSE